NRAFSTGQAGKLRTGFCNPRLPDAGHASYPRTFAGRQSVSQGERSVGAFEAPRARLVAGGAILALDRDERHGAEPATAGRTESSTLPSGGSRTRSYRRASMTDSSVTEGCRISVLICTR